MQLKSIMIPIIIMGGDSETELSSTFIRPILKKLVKKVSPKTILRRRESKLAIEHDMRHCHDDKRRQSA